MKKKYLAQIFIIALFFGCEEDNNFTADTGIVQYMSFEGGFYGIMGNDGENYLPDKLTDEFKVDGLKIYFEGTITDLPTTVQWGRTISITKIQKIE